MARSYENRMNQPTPPAPPVRPPGGASRMQAGEQQARQEKRRMVPRPAPQPRREMPEGIDYSIVPGGMGGSQAGQSMRDGLGDIASFLATPSRVARGAVEGGVQAINPDFQMPGYGDAQMPGIDFIRDMMMRGNQDMAPNFRPFNPTEAMLRAYFERMQAGQ